MELDDIDDGDPDEIEQMLAAAGEQLTWDPDEQVDVSPFDPCIRRRSAVARRHSCRQRPGRRPNR